jgi:hypothetical protein
MEWSEAWRDAFRIELRAEAVRLACRGWPVLPGSYPDAAGRWASGPGRPTDALRPVHAGWQRSGPAEPERVAAAFSGAPYSLLVATGEVLDAIEVPDELGRGIASALRQDGVPVPMAATPDGRWLLLVDPSSASPELAEELAHHRVRLHGRGSYVPVPPTPYPHGIVHWRVKPEVAGPALPPANVVLEAVVRALGDPPSLRGALTAENACPGDGRPRGRQRRVGVP